MTKGSTDAGQGTVVGFRRAGRQVTYPAIAAIDGYWTALGAGGVPHRRDLDPRRLDAALPHACLLERIAPGVARFRLAGMHFNDLMGMEVRGMPISAMLLPEARGPLSDILEDVALRPAVAVLSLTAERGLGRPALRARAWLAPLMSDEGAGRRILGGVEAVGGIGRAPRRFAIEEVYLRSVEGPGPARAVTAPAPVLAKGLAEPQAGFTPAPHAKGPDARHPALYLVKSD